MKKIVFVGILILFSNIHSGFGQVFEHNDGKGVSKNFVEHLDYYTPVVMEFDSHNRPYIINNIMYSGRTSDDMNCITTLRNGIWTHFSYEDEVEAILPEGITLSYSMWQSHKVQMCHTSDMVIDENDNLYAIAKVFVNYGSRRGGMDFLLFAKNIGSSDFNGEFQVFELPSGSGYARLERRNGHNDFSKHPPILAYNTNFNEDVYPNINFAKWSDLNIVPTSLDENGDLVLGEPIIVDNQAGAHTTHSGGKSFAVTHGDFTYFIWLRHSADPAVDATGNNETWINVLDRRTNTLGTNTYLQTNLPARADGHSTPTIAMDGEGFIHVLGGAHATSGFEYSKSLNPYDISEWSAAMNIGADRTYSSIAIDNENNMFSFFRASGGLYFHAAMAPDDYDNNYGILFANNPPCGEYLAFYNHMYLDRALNGNNNRLYASWLTNCGANTDNCDTYRVLAFSDDIGESWSVPTRHDFLDRMINEKNIQRIVFDKFGETPKIDPFEINATTNAEENGVPLALNYSIVSGNELASISGTTITPTGERGTIVVKAENGGNDAYYADEATLTIEVGISGPIQNFTLFPEADAFVADQAVADRNFGLHQSLKVRGNNSIYSFNSYLRFDLSSISGVITSAKLVLAQTSASNSPENVDFSVLFVSDDTWDEGGDGTTGITWNTKPAGSTVLDSQKGVSNNGDLISWDVTAQAEIERQGDGKLSLMIEESTYTELAYFVLASKDFPDPDLWPVLLITTDIGTSLKEDSKTESLVVYPNPVSDDLQIISSSAINEVQVINMFGSLMNRYKNAGKSNSMRINMAGYLKQTYLLKVIGADNSFEIRKVIKN